MGLVGLWDSFIGYKILRVVNLFSHLCPRKVHRWTLESGYMRESYIIMSDIQYIGHPTECVEVLANSTQYLKIWDLDTPILSFFLFWESNNLYKFINTALGLCWNHIYKWNKNCSINLKKTRVSIVEAISSMYLCLAQKQKSQVFQHNPLNW